MSTAVAAAHGAASLTPSAVEHQISPRQFAAIAPSTTHSGLASAPPPSTTELPAVRRARSNGSPPDSAHGTSAVAERSAPDDKSSPASARSGLGPIIKVKKEPGSPSLGPPRHRPKRLDLSSSMASSRGPQTARSLTSRDSAGLAIQEVGLACLSPGFQTNDPGMREQLQRSLDVRDQQRQIIEARKIGTKPGSSHERSDGPRTQDNTLFGVPTDARTPTNARRKGPPPGLSISAPSASQFTNDRVVQSAPLHQTFTGLRPGDYPSSRHTQHGPSNLGRESHIHHVPATQTTNRLPPIADVFANDRLDAPRAAYNDSPSHSSNSNTIPAPLHSPSFPPPQQHHSGPPHSARTREFRSAEEAVQGMTGGRDDLMPKLVHYGGVVQPPTPPSPMPTQNQHHHHHHHAPQSTPSTTAGAPRPDTAARASSMNGRRRTREEYERDNGSPPSHSGYPHHHYYPHHHSQHEPKRPNYDARGPPAVSTREDSSSTDWRAGMSNQEKREEFLRLCERAWDLFHS